MSLLYSTLDILSDKEKAWLWKRNMFTLCEIASAGNICFGLNHVIEEK